ncbi:MAG: hypothetical protein LBS46_07315 [Dysgonamonadaceae bacterium]|nr:hypothetical protein [Dysgonamonadaceae bacterium]
MPKVYYACYPGIIILLLSGLTCLLSACKQEWPGAGKKISVHFLLQGTSFSEGSTVTHSSSDESLERESVVVPVDDNLYMSASLESVPLEATREGEIPLADNVRLRIAAYQSGEFIASAEYRVESNTCIAVGEELSVSAGTYTFVAYSYNTAEPLPNHLTEVQLSPENAADGNFLWGTSTQEINAANRSVDIIITHKLSKASVRLSTENITNYYIISTNDVMIGPGYNVKMNIKDGTFTKMPDNISQYVTGFSGTSTLSTSEERLVFTNSEQPTTVSIGTILFLVSVPYTQKLYSQLTASFSTALVPNKKYVLRVDFVQQGGGGEDPDPPSNGLLWARSNVYWDGSKLTFKAHNDTGQEEYQGVYFKWGSLQGMSSSGPSWNSSLALYNSKNQTTIADWGNIVSLSGTDITTNHGTGADYFKNNGNYDICRYLGNEGTAPTGYRMPTYNELFFGSPYKNNSGGWNGWWSQGGGSTWTKILAPSNSNGQNTIGGGGFYDSSVLFPAAGYRTDNAGTLKDVGAVGFYWTSSPRFGKYDAYYFHFTNGGITASGATYAPRTLGCVVRCVLDY